MRPAPSLALLLPLVLFAAPGAAQHRGHDHAPGAPSDAHARVQAYAEEHDAVIASGRGFGMAFAADQHGYPGPMHVLELKDLLRLTPEQEARMQALMHAMFAESRPKSARLLELEARLRALFASGTADEARVRAAVADVEGARAEVRLVHLLAHVKTREVLTEAQRTAYHAARWPDR
ncbi:MAG TPA: Spy/CpxP family protein refolding chaperone [Methylomirabilota bacterium]|jgi:Spy/CpxP family protein refolding chaperone|nr:Spy/CpxP family protein refolding chaperone [Methylomirabilota bacterium]